MKTSKAGVVLVGILFAIVLRPDEAGAELRKEWIEYRDGDTVLSGYLVYDDAFSGRRPGVLLAHDRAGLAETGNALHDSDLIAGMGYVVFAADIYGKANVPRTTAEMNVQTTLYANDRPRMRTRAAAALEVLRSASRVNPSKIAVIGYCFGGLVALELAETGAALVGTVSVHGAFRNFAPEAAKNINGRVLILHGAEDTAAPLRDVNAFVDQLRTAKVDWQLTIYSGSSHTFTRPQNPSEERADRAYKTAIARFFEEVFSD